MSAGEWITQVMRAVLTLGIVGVILVMHLEGKEVPSGLRVVGLVAIAQYVPELLNIVRDWVKGRVNGNGKGDGK